MEVEEGGRNGGNKDVGILGNGNKRGLDYPSFLLPNTGRQTFGLIRIMRKEPKIVIR